MRLLACLLLAVSSLNASTILTDPIGSAKLELRVFGEAILAPSDSFQTMHTGFLFVPGEGVYAYGTPLTSAGAGAAEQVSVWILSDTVNINAGGILDADVWHTPILPGGDSLVNPLIPDSLFDVRSNALFEWSDSCLCGYTSDPFMLLDRDSVKTFLVRAAMTCYKPDQKTQNVNLIYTVRWDGSAGLDTALLINGYYNNGSAIEPIHSSLSLYAPSVVVEDNLYRIFTIEDTLGGRSLALWESTELNEATTAPADWVSKRKLLGGQLVDHHNLAIIQWQLPDSDLHWHTTVHSPEPGIYEGFATGSLIDNQPVYFGSSSDAEHWTTYPVPIIPAGGNRPGTPIIDSTVYTVRPFIVTSGPDFHYRLVISGARDTAETYAWNSTVVDMFRFESSAPSAPVAISPTTGVCPVFDLQPTFCWSPSVDPDAGDTVMYQVHLATDSLFASSSLSAWLTETVFLFADSLALSTPFWWKILAHDGGLFSESSVQHFWTVTPGDVNTNHVVNVADLTHLVSYLFRGGLLPCSPVTGDINGDCSTNVADLTFLVNFLFRDGTPPRIGCVDK